MASENYNSLSKKEAIEQLRQTIKQLETITEQLETTSVIDLPSSTSIQTLIATATDLEKIIAQKSVLQENFPKEQSVESNISSEVKANSEAEVEEVVPSAKDTSEPKIRVFEPKPIEREITEKKERTEPNVQQNPIVENQLQANRNKRTLVGIAAALLIIIVPLSWKLFLTNETPQLIARETPKTITRPIPEPVVIPTPIREEDEPAIENEIAQTDVEPVLQDTPENIVIPPIEPIEKPIPIEESEPAIDDVMTQKEPQSSESIIEPKTNLIPKIPNKLVAENKPRKLAIETIDPNLKLTPEQSLIAALESKTNNLASRYNDDLVVAIEPNFIDSVVVVTVADRWYELAAPNQDKIVSEMLKRSRSLEFDKLKITDTRNTLIARSPVIGEDMIVLRRTT